MEQIAYQFVAGGMRWACEPHRSRGWFKRCGSFVAASTRAAPV